MLWPYVCLSFVVLFLFRHGFVYAASLAAAAAIVLLALDLKRARRNFYPVFGLGIFLGFCLFLLRTSSTTNAPPPTQGAAEVTGVSRKSVILQLGDGQKIRLTGLKKLQIPRKHARVFYRCESQEVRDSTFLVFENLSGVKTWCRMLEIRTLSDPSGHLATYQKMLLDFLQSRFNSIGEKSLISAFVLGDTDDLTPQELDAFRDMGLMHLFAVSGLNIALLFAIIYLPFRWLRLPAIGSALGYTVATGFLLLLDFPIPLLRAWLFMTIGLGMRVLDRRLPAWTLLFLTACLTEILFPFSTFTMSFVLSFGVTAAILVFYQPLLFCFAAKNRALNFLAEHAALTLAAGLPALILGYLLFGTANPLSLFYNFLLVPFSGLYLFISLIYLFLEPLRFVLLGLDALYLKFANGHTTFVMARFPVAEPTSQIVSLIFIAFLLTTLYWLSRRHYLWSARRNLRSIIPVTAIILLLPYILMKYPSHAIYAIPNKVWMYEQGRLYITGTEIFVNDTPTEPKACFPITQRQPITNAQKFSDVYQVAGRCVVFAGRIKPETWPVDGFQNCQSIDVFQSQKQATSGAAWSDMFALFGFRGKVVVRKYFTWYGDQSAPCIKASL